MRPKRSKKRPKCMTFRPSAGTGSRSARSIAMYSLR
jgi:hypothetical protein